MPSLITTCGDCRGEGRVFNDSVIRALRGWEECPACTGLGFHVNRGS